MGCESETVTTIAELEAAFERARAADRTYVIAIRTTQYDWTEGGNFWEVGVPEVSGRPSRARGTRRDADRQALPATRLNNERNDRDVTIINGGTQGLGEALARKLVAQGAKGLVLAGRSADRGEALAAELTGLGTPTRSSCGPTSPTRPHRRRSSPPVTNGSARCTGWSTSPRQTSRATLFTDTPDHFDKMIDVNVKAPYFLIQAAARLMLRDGVRGSIVNIGSTSRHGGQARLAAYSMSKGALAIMTRNLAYALMRHGIRVNQVNPGWMDTESEHITQITYDGAPDDWLIAAEAGRPFGRLVKPWEVANMIAFCLSDESGMLTGNLIDVDQSVHGAGDASKPSSRRHRNDALVTLRIAVLGVGRIGRMHAELIARQVAGASLAMVQDVNGDAAADGRRRLGVPHTTDVDAVLGVRRCRRRRDLLAAPTRTCR